MQVQTVLIKISREHDIQVDRNENDALASKSKKSMTDEWGYLFLTFNLIKFKQFNYIATINTLTSTHTRNGRALHDLLFIANSIYLLCK